MKALLYRVMGMGLLVLTAVASAGPSGPTKPTGDAIQPFPIDFEWLPFIPFM